MNYETLARAQAAKNVLELHDFKVFVEEVRKDVFSQWVRTNVNETEKREQLHSVINGMEILLAKANSYVSAAEFEEAKEQNIPEG